MKYSVKNPRPWRLPRFFKQIFLGGFQKNSDLRFLQAQIYSRGVLKKYEMVVDITNVGLASSSKVEVIVLT